MKTEKIPEAPLSMDGGTLSGRLFPHYLGSTVEYRYGRYLSWIGYAFIVAGIAWGALLHFSFPFTYFGIATSVLGLLFIASDISTSKTEKRILIDKRNKTVEARSAKELFWSIPLDRIVAVQIAYKYFPTHSDMDLHGKRVSAYGAYQVNLVWSGDEDLPKREMITGWRWRFCVQPLAESMARVLGVLLVDHATPAHVARAKGRVPCGPISQAGNMLCTFQDGKPDQEPKNQAEQPPGTLRG